MTTTTSNTTRVNVYEGVSWQRPFRGQQSGCDNANDWRISCGQSCSGMQNTITNLLMASSWFNGSDKPA